MKIKGFYYYSIPLLKKEPRHVVLHMRTNDAPYSTAQGVLQDVYFEETSTMQSYFFSASN